MTASSRRRPRTTSGAANGLGRVTRRASVMLSPVLLPWVLLGSWVPGCSTVIGAGDYKVGVKPSDTGILPGAGESTCSESCDDGLSCVVTRYGPSGVCTYGCTDDAECAPTHSCVGSPLATDNFPKSCMRTCAGDGCASGFVCLRLNDASNCYPRDWARGIGDPCVTDSDCASGNCEGAPRGWCSRMCGSNAACAGDYLGEANVEGEQNVCVQVRGNQICVPGCAVASSCQSFGNTNCRRVSPGVSACTP